MNTPAHAVINLLILSKSQQPKANLPIILGAILPDLPMILFYSIQKLLRTPETEIWSKEYYQEGWQAFFDLFNSLPLFLIGSVLAYRIKNTWWFALFASMSLHVLGDLPLHHEDAHRHFFPFFDWRFQSPLSYWDPKHYGNWVSKLEILSVLGASVYLFRFIPHTQKFLVWLLVIYFGYWGYTWYVWG